MPHVVVKMHKGRTLEQKEALSEKIQQAVMQTLNVSETYISVSVEDYDPKDWPEVYKEEITDKPDTLFIKPNYKP